MLKNDLWVFGYASLIWQPGFSVAEKQLARLDGFSRSFCMRSIHHRGTNERNGLVLALDAEQDAVCHGMAFRVADEHAMQTMNYLRERELISSAYLEEIVSITLSDGRTCDAVSYVIDRNHDQYCTLPLEEQAQIIATAVGGRGPNTEYLYNTANSLAELEIEDSEMFWLVDRVQEITAKGAH